MTGFDVVLEKQSEDVIKEYANPVAKIMYARDIETLPTIPTTPLKCLKKLKMKTKS